MWLRNVSGKTLASVEAVSFHLFKHSNVVDIVVGDLVHAWWSDGFKACDVTCSDGWLMNELVI